LAFITFATLCPAHLRPRLTTTEPGAIVLLEHFGAFFLLGVLFAISYARRYGVVFVVVLGSAILLECFQIIMPDRDARLIDVLQKMAGGSSGIIATHWIASSIAARVAQ